MPYAATASAFALLRTRPRTVWPSAIRADATAPPIKPFAPVMKICILALARFGRDESVAANSSPLHTARSKIRDYTARAATRESYRPNWMWRSAISYLDSRVIDDRASALQARLRSISWRRGGNPHRQSGGWPIRSWNPAFAHRTCLLRSLLTKERGHPRDLKRKVEKDRKDRAGD